MKKTLFLFPLVLFLAVSWPSQGAGMHFVDWFQSRDRAYQDLKQALAQAGLSMKPGTGLAGSMPAAQAGPLNGPSGWVVDRIRGGYPIPQASARDLAAQLEADPAVSQDLKDRLRQDLPSEAGQFQDHRAQILGKVQDLGQRMDALDHQVGEIEKSFARNNYGPYSSPLDSITLVSSGDYQHWLGIEPAQWGGPAVALEDTFNGTTGAMNYSFHFDLHYDQELSNSNWQTPSQIASILYIIGGSNATLLINRGWLAGTQFELGMEFYGFSHLLFSGPGFRPSSPFFMGTDASTIGDVAPSGQRTVQGLLIQKQGQSGWWWPFTNTQIVLEPLYLGGENNPYLPYAGPYSQHANEFAARLDLAGLNFIPGTQDSIPYLMTDLVKSDQAQLNGFQLNDTAFNGVGVPETDQAYGLGLTTQLDTGGQVLFEAATSDWQRQDSVQGYPGYDKHFTGQAYYLNYTDTFGPLSLGLEASQVDPYFITGGHEGYASGNQQAGSTFDSTVDDPRPGNWGDTTWETLSLDPTVISNNTQRAFLNATWLGSWSTLQLSGGVSKQINPSGPWIRASEYFDNNQNNGYSWFNLFGEHYSYWLPGEQVNSAAINPALVGYNGVTQGQAYYHGQPLQYPAVLSNGIPYGTPPAGVYWDDLTQLFYRWTTQTIWLSQNGVGDPNLRADSVKYLNSARLDWTIDFQALMGSELPRNLKLFSQYEDTAEQLQAPGLGAAPLLRQVADGADLLWDLNEAWEIVAMAGYETWNSQYSYFPVAFLEKTAGLGVNLQLAPLLRGLTVNLRCRYYGHEDLNFENRSFSGWIATLGSTYVLNN